MADTSARLLKLLSLLQTRRDWTGPELARRLDVGARTVRRDVERLRGLGYPIDASRGVAGGYRLAAGSALPPLLLDAEEAVAVAVGLRTAASVGVSGIEESSVRALAKLEQVMPVRLRGRVAAVGWATVPLPVGGPAVDPEVLATIAAAARNSEGLRFRYRNHDGSDARRAVQPHRLVHTGRRWYLVAWDLDREDWRTFRADRIAAGISLDRRFTPREPPAPDLAAYVVRGVASARRRHQARVLLHAPIEQMRGRVPPAYGSLAAAGNDSCLLTAEADWLGGLAVYIANIGVDFEVSEPPELIEMVRELARRFGRAAAA